MAVKKITTFALIVSFIAALLIGCGETVATPSHQSAVPQNEIYLAYARIEDHDGVLIYRMQFNFIYTDDQNLYSFDFCIYEKGKPFTAISNCNYVNGIESQPQHETFGTTTIVTPNTVLTVETSWLDVQTNVALEWDTICVELRTYACGTDYPLDKYTVLATKEYSVSNLVELMIGKKDTQ